MPTTASQPRPRPRADRVPTPPRRFRGGWGRVMAERVLIGAVTIVLAVNVWTGFPLVALWVGSQLAGGNPLSMRGVVFVLLTLIVFVVLAYHALARLSARYDDLTGRPPGPREPPPWLVSLRGGRAADTHRRRQTNLVERIIMLTVVAGLLSFEAWFFLLAHYAPPT